MGACGRLRGRPRPPKFHFLGFSGVPWGAPRGCGVVVCMFFGAFGAEKHANNDATAPRSAPRNPRKPEKVKFRRRLRFVRVAGCYRSLSQPPKWAQTLL